MFSDREIKPALIAPHHSGIILGIELQQQSPIGCLSAVGKLQLAELN